MSSAHERRMPQIAGVTHHEVDAGGLRMHVVESVSGPLLVLVHGWPRTLKHLAAHAGRVGLAHH